jgi:SecD/SecF fusion protein
MNKRLLYKTILILAVVGISAYYAFPLNKRINLGLDLQGGMHLVLKIDTSKLTKDAKADIQDRAVEIIRNRIDQFGVREPSIQKQGDDEVAVQLPGVTDRDRAIDLIGQTALLEFRIVSNDPEQLKAAIQGNVPAGYELKSSIEDNEPLLLSKETLLTGDALKNASVRFDQSSFGQPVVSLEMNPEGAKKFSEITTNNVGKRLAIVLDGKVQSAPNIKEPIPSGEAVISGHFTIEKAQDLALVLRVGALPAPMHIEEERTVGPLLGKDSIDKGVKAGYIGLVWILGFMVIYYFLAGFIADFALVLNLVMILGGLGLLPFLFPGISATLTLPGIAGIALSLGMAVDANVLINERIREERESGKPLRTAIANGYNRAFSAILDSHVTSLISAFLLFQFGTGPIRGFAVTLTIGLCASLFTSIVVTRTIVEGLVELKWLKSMPMLKLIRNTTKIDFIGKRKIFFALSIILICAGAVAFFSRGKNSYGIDFSGGQIEQYAFKDNADMDKIRSALKEIGLGDVPIQQFKDNPKVIQIKTAMDKGNIITQELKKRFPAQDVQVLKVERVGPIAGKQLQTKALKALFWSLIGIMFYLALRFKNFNFAVAGIISLFHDSLLSIGFMAMTGRPVDLLTVSAILTIVGYSINDTIIVFDRVRENSHMLRKISLYDLLNLSVNQTLSRTIITTGVTLFTVASFMLWGGEVLSNFAFTLLVGFICGIYSTVYIVSPLVLAWKKTVK